MLRTASLLPLHRAFDAGLRRRAFPPDAASLLPGLLAATRTGLTPAGDDELTNHDQPPTWPTSKFCWAYESPRLSADEDQLAGRRAGLRPANEDCQVVCWPSSQLTMARTAPERAPPMMIRSHRAAGCPRQVCLSCADMGLPSALRSVVRRRFSTLKHLRVPSRLAGTH